MYKEAALLSTAFLMNGSCFSSNAPIDASGNRMSISIKNNLDFEFHEARINIDSSDTWLDIGKIKEGNNIFHFKNELASEKNIIQLKYPNGQWATGIVNRLTPGAIHFEINKEIETGLITEWDKNSIPGTMPAKISYSIQDNTVRQEMLYPIDRKYKYGWYTECHGGGLGVNFISCEIDATPAALGFNGVGGGLIPVIESHGVWSSDLSRNELWGQAGKWKAFGLLYFELTMDWHSKFKGGGAVAGFVNGDGKINGRPPKTENPPPPPPPPEEKEFDDVTIESLTHPGKCLTPSRDREHVELKDCNSHVRWSKSSNGEVFTFFYPEPGVPPFVPEKPAETRCLKMNNDDDKAFFLLNVSLVECSSSHYEKDWVWDGIELVKWGAQSTKYALGLRSSVPEDSIHLYSYDNKDYEFHPLAKWRLNKQ